MALTEALEPASRVAPARGSRWRLSAITPASNYYWVRLLMQNPAVVLSLLLLLAMLIVAIFAPVIAPFDPTFVNPADRLDPPSSTYWFGTDDLGRDVFSRVIYGARISLLVGVTVMIGATVVGSLIGLAAGYYRKADTPLMRLMDGLEAFPSILLALVIMATLGPAVENVIVALTVVYTPNIARLVRGTTLMNRQQTYVESARAIGMRDFPILRRYIFANSLSPLIVQCTFVVAFAILTEASLSFLGAGVPPDIPTWGSIVSSGQPRLQQAWWISVFAGTFLFVTVLATNLIGDGLRDALDPRSRRR
ncbi:MAG: binding-protein-dependent transport system inner rane component [Thermomicrobiales bacterium]|jgi:peptide/nickel transport system permease protein|nr:binding-protein-dependent transport system inner rane component [Thermomicrobiales bacterium]MDF3041619.1 binding-protein-dependent transport system inner rane component [Thermomicrobiales bacterium]